MPATNRFAYCLTALVLTTLLSAADSRSAEVGTYTTAWSAAHGFRLKSFDQSGVADRFTYLNYAFANVYRLPDGSYQCQQGADRDNQGAGLGMNGSADYAVEFAADQSVDGSADQPDQPLAGNFNQLRELKQRHPNLKILLSIGGWDWSRWFSAASMTAHSRQTLVASCINLYMRGNLPRLNGHGGPAAAAGLFDGFDLDWEHPGMAGAPYNTFNATDRQHFTKLLAEFRRQLNAFASEQVRRGHAGTPHYFLSAAIGASIKNIRLTDPGRYARYLDRINLMSYDFHGSWDATGPTDFHANLYPDPASPDPEHPSVDTAVQLLRHAGVPARKIIVGIPFYGRGWKGVAATNDGLYQPAAAPADAAEPGAAPYRELARLNGPRHTDARTQQMWTFDGDVFWSFDDAQVVRSKADYARQNGLGGMMSWTIDQDDEAFSLARAMLTVREGEGN